MMITRCTQVIGARAGTVAAKSMEHVSVFVGSYVPDFKESCYEDIFPAGTLARHGANWYEVRWVDKRSRFEPVRIDPPQPSEIVTREGEVKHA